MLLSEVEPGTGISGRGAGPPICPQSSKVAAMLTYTEGSMPIEHEAVSNEAVDTKN